MGKLIKNLRKGIREHKVAIAIIASVQATHYLGDCVIDNVRKEAQAREQRVVQFYQQNGVCPSDATPAYLDLRTQLWQRDVESKS